MTVDHKPGPETRADELDEHTRELRASASCNGDAEPTATGYRCLKCKRRQKECGDCTSCGWATMAIIRTELRPATCRHCKEPFLWRWQPASGPGLERRAPRACPACRELLQARRYRTLSEKLQARSAETRVQMRATVARFKPKETAET